MTSLIWLVAISLPLPLASSAGGAACLYRYYYLRGGGLIHFFGSRESGGADSVDEKLLGELLPAIWGE